MNYVEITGAVEGTSVYADDVAVARNATVKLPEITRVAYTQKTALGEQEFLTNLLESMEASVTKIGIDINSMRLAIAKKLEYRWVQSGVNSEGVTRNYGCKAIMRIQAATPVPGGEMEVGSVSENEHTYKVLVYTLYIDGQEVINVNRLTGKCNIFGVNYDVNDSFL